MKIVINACFGGFHPSNRAIKAYADRKGWPCYFFQRPGWKGQNKRITDEEAFANDELFSNINAYRVASPEELPPEQDGWGGMTMEERKASNEAWTLVGFEIRDIPRDDADFVAVVESLGEAASGKCSKLKIVEIPDDTEFQIEEYDGYEHVAEKHRTWS